MSPGPESGSGGQADDRATLEDLLRDALKSGKETREMRKLVDSIDAAEYRAILSKIQREKHIGHPLRLRYSDQQMVF